MAACGGEADEQLVGEGWRPEMASASEAPSGPSARTQAAGAPRTLALGSGPPTLEIVARPLARVIKVLACGRVAVRLDDQLDRPLQARGRGEQPGREAEDPADDDAKRNVAR